MAFEIIKLTYLLFCSLMGRFFFVFVFLCFRCTCCFILFYFILFKSGNETHNHTHAHTRTKYRNLTPWNLPTILYLFCVVTIPVLSISLETLVSITTYIICPAWRKTLYEVTNSTQR